MNSLNNKVYEEVLEAILSELEDQEKQFEEECSKIGALEDVDKLRIRYLGRKGKLSHYFSQLANLPPEQKPILGQNLNKFKKRIQDRISLLQQNLAQTAEADSDAIDLTLPGIHPLVGRFHPLLQILDDIKEIFKSLGFAIELGAEAETEFHNFEALNIPEHHPSRDEHDTLYLSGNMLLRTHTSPVQIRTMLEQKPPIRMIAPGRCYRKDTPDATHSPMFHQVEGLAVDEDISFADLKAVLLAFTQKLFKKETKLRFRPSYFPFTEPSAEVDIWWETNHKGGKWLEILGCGMVDPAVFEHVGYDSEKYTGYAFGMGIERIALLKYGMTDIRVFFENDLRFIHQF